MIFHTRWQHSRRAWLKSAIFAGGCAWAGIDAIATIAASLPQPLNPFKGQFLGVLPFVKESKLPLETLMGRNLDARLYTDLSKLSPDTAQIPIPSDRFYVRTSTSALLQRGDVDNIQLIARTNTAMSLLSAKSVQKTSRPMGMHLLECAGNARDASFGLMSTAEWAGVPLIEVLEPFGKLPPDTLVLISGFDRYDAISVSSQPGASWIFSPAQLRSSNAFLATAMNGSALSPDHGAPIRLVVPGWYGCACIKWVNEIRLTGPDVAPTSQMEEFAQRTHQEGLPKLAREFQAATIDAAAMPVRVEKWRVDEKIRYRVIGILWGGTEPVHRLEIRFNPEEDYVPVDNLQVAELAKSDSWNFWTHSWTPTSPGPYLIRVQIAEPRVRTRRLDKGYYVREVEVHDT